MMATCANCGRHVNCALQLVFDPLDTNPHGSSRHAYELWFCSGICLTEWSERKHRR